MTPKAHIYGMESYDFSWFKDDSFTYISADLHKPAEMGAAVADLPKFDAIFDDGTHVSHHQQNAFLELWPRLASGGIYAIENLRWQPSDVERKGYTKSSELFDGYQVSGSFEHSDRAMQEKLNALRKDISGCFTYQVGFDRSRKHQLAILQKR